MAATESSLPFPARPGLTRRRTFSQQEEAAAGGGGVERAPIHFDVDPPPKTKPIFQLLAFAFIVFFAALQLLPATHLRDPSNPYGGAWIPVDRSPSPPHHHTPSDRTLHVASWIDCLDLRLLAVLVNSTLTSSADPDRLHFHFFIPSGGDDKTPFYKLKLLFPDSNIVVVGEREIGSKIAAAAPEIARLWPLPPPALAPFLIPAIDPSLKRFVFLPPSSIVKGSIDDLFATDMDRLPVAAAEDCGTRLRDLANMEVLNAIQRTAGKVWVSRIPYDGDACVPDLAVLLLDGEALRRSVLPVVLWWNAALGNEVDGEGLHPAVVLALSAGYHKLAPSWKLGGSRLSEDGHVLRFDGPRLRCSGGPEQQEVPAFGHLWKQHISGKSELILAH